MLNQTTLFLRKINSLKETIIYAKKMGELFSEEDNRELINDLDSCLNSEDVIKEAFVFIDKDIDRLRDSEDADADALLAAYMFFLMDTSIDFDDDDDDSISIDNLIINEDKIIRHN